MTTARVSRVRVACAAVTVLLLAAPFASSIALAQAEAGQRCLGEAATIVGSKGAPRVVGTAGPDVIVARRRGGQEVHGLAGDDLLCGDDRIFGGRGDDRMRERGEKFSVEGATLSGGPGNDTIFRSKAVEILRDFQFRTFGGPGHDRLFGGPNPDLVRGGPGADRIFGLGWFDEISGGRGPDVLVGGSRRDHLGGNIGDDRLRGEGGNDDIRGGPGDDLGRGGRGNDQVSGGDGVDVAVGGPDVDSCQAETAHCERP